MSIYDFDIFHYMFYDEMWEFYKQGDVFTNPAIKDAGDIDTDIIRTL